MKGQPIPKMHKYFTTAYFRDADELIEEVKELGVAFREILAVEGLCRLMKDLSDRWRDEKSLNKLLYVPLMIEMEPKIAGYVTIR